MGLKSYHFKHFRGIMRLDQYLVDIGRFDSRQKAQEAIKEGRVIISGKVVRKAAFQVDSGEMGKKVDSREVDSRVSDKKVDSRIAVCGDEYVSRAGKKLQGFLEECKGQGIFKAWGSAIDVGAARGGFTQVLLRYGVQRVCCVDVGSNQLHPKIAQDSRVEVFEQCDIRDFTRKYGRRFDVVVCDVSFIGIGCIVDDLCGLGDEVIVLFKPQFEVGRGIKRSRRGVVQDQEAVQRALQECIATICARGFAVSLVAESSVKGKEGNAEFFIYACRESSI